jgi:hypothetical protein
MKVAAPIHTDKFITKTIPPAHCSKDIPIPITSANAYKQVLQVQMTMTMSHTSLLALSNLELLMSLH